MYISYNHSYLYLSIVPWYATKNYCFNFVLWKHQMQKNCQWKIFSSSSFQNISVSHTHTHTHTRLTALFPWLPRWARTRKVKPIWILLEQETLSGSGISWAVCKSAPRSRQITTPAPHHSVFYRPDALPATQPIASKHWRNSWCQDNHKITSSHLCSYKFNRYFSFLLQTCFSCSSCQETFSG